MMAERMTGANLPAYLEATGWTADRHGPHTIYRKDGRAICWGLHEGIHTLTPEVFRPLARMRGNSVSLCEIDAATAFRWLSDTPSDEVVACLTDGLWTMPERYWSESITIWING